MKSFKTIAKELTTLSPLMTNRDKIETSDIRKFHANGIHICAVDQMQDADSKRFYVYNFKENEEVFAFSGEVLNKVIDGWVKACEGDIEQVNKILAEEPVGVILGDGVNKNKQHYTTVQVIDE